MPQVNRVLGAHPRVPPAVVALPELHVADRRNREECQLAVQVRTVHWIEEQVLSGVGEGPQGVSLAGHLVLSSLFV